MCNYINNCAYEINETHSRCGYLFWNVKLSFWYCFYSHTNCRHSLSQCQIMTLNG